MLARTRTRTGDRHRIGSVPSGRGGVRRRDLDSIHRGHHLDLESQRQRPRLQAQDPVRRCLDSWGAWEVFRGIAIVGLGFLMFGGILDGLYFVSVALSRYMSFSSVSAHVIYARYCISGVPRPPMLRCS